MSESNDWISDDQNRRRVDGVEYVAVEDIGNHDILGCATCDLKPASCAIVGGSYCTPMSRGDGGYKVWKRLAATPIGWADAVQATTDATTARDMATQYQGRLYGMPRDTELAEAINTAAVLLAAAAVELDKVAALEVG